MKKHLLTLVTSALAIISLRADVIFYEGFPYQDGPIDKVGTNAVPPGPAATNWFRHSGSGNDALVHNHKLENAATGGSPLSRQDDVTRALSVTNNSIYTNSQQIIYASFTINCTNLPLDAGNYFAHFKDQTTSNFVGKVFALTGIPGNTNPAVNFTRLPNTWRLGISCGSNNVIKTFPVDLATNTDYQVVLGYDPASVVAQLWVDPLNSADTSVTAFDSVIAVLQSVKITSFAFRQASGAGNAFFTITNLAGATTFDEAATNVWSTNAVSPVILYQPQNTTNYAANSASLLTIAAGQGLTSLTYQWQKEGANISNPNGNTNYFSISSLVAGDEGNYDVVVTVPSSGLSVTSSVAYLAVITTPTPPYFTSLPHNITNGVGTTATFSATATGTGPISYQWQHEGTNIADGSTGLPGDGSVTSGSQTSTLTISSISTNQTGNYSVMVTGGASPATNSPPVYLQASPPRAVSIAFLRSLLSTSTWQTTDSTTPFTITGVETSSTNLTGGQASYYLQDSSGGLNLFITAGTSFNTNSHLGDIITATGTLISFSDNLELAPDPANPYHSYSIVGHVNTLPAPYVFAPILTNNLGFMETNVEGIVIMLTNVFFPKDSGGNGGTNTGTGNLTITVTNGGVPFLMFFPQGQDLDLRNRVRPSFAWTVTGIANQFFNTPAGTATNAGYEIAVTRWQDVVTNPPPAVTATIGLSGNNVVLSWPAAAPYSVTSFGAYCYSVLVASDVTGPYTPLATGLTFTDTSGAYADEGTNTYEAILSGTNEVPSNASTASGYGFVVVSPDQTHITVTMSFSGLDAAATAAHIHGPAAAGSTASPIFTFAGVPAATSGSIPQQSFAITPTQLGYLRSGLLYMNVHDNPNFGGGEIRSQLVPATSHKFYRVVSP